MSVELDEVRREVANAHGLGADAAKLLSGTTIDEVEASAAELARFVTGRRAELQSEPEPRDLIAEALSAKAERRQALARMFAGRSGPARDQHGRFASSGFRMDGGARPVVPAVPDPDGDHARLVLRLARARALGDTGFLAQ